MEEFGDDMDHPMVSIKTRYSSFGRMTRALIPSRPPKATNMARKASSMMNG